METKEQAISCLVSVGYVLESLTQGEYSIDERASLLAVYFRALDDLIPEDTDFSVVIGGVMEGAEDLARRFRSIHEGRIIRKDMERGH